jgi:choline dehydrogenase-like flavoprotein
MSPASAALSDGERATLEAVSRALIPAGGPFAPGAADVGVVPRILEMSDEMDPTSAGLVRLLLRTIELAPVFGRPGRRFSRLSEEEAEAFLAATKGSTGLASTSIWLLRLLAEANFVATPEVHRALDIRRVPLYDDPPVPPARPPVPTVGPAEVGDGGSIDVDACIIGSGAGGAPAAAILAEAGWKVAVLEEGPAVSRPDFEGSPIRRIGRYYRYNGIYFTLGKPMVQISFASSVGGTTVFNSGSCFRPPDSTLGKWEKECHLPSVRPQELAPHFERVLRFLQVAEPRADILGKNAEVSRRGAERLAPPLRHGVIPRPAPGCRGSDECVLGCPTDSKRSMALSYLPRAVAAGARVYSRVRALRVRAGPGGAARWIVQGRWIDPATRRLGGTLTVRCRHAIVAAGAMHTPYLLPPVGDRRARRHRGRHLRVHPSFDVAGDFPEEIRGWRGVLQSYFIDDYDHGVLLEATFQPRGMLSTSGLTPFAGRSYKEFFPRLPHLAIMGGLVMDESEGRLGPFLFGRPWAFYDMNEADLRKVGRGLALSGRIFFAAGASRVFLPLHGGMEVRRPEELDRFEREVPPAHALHLLAFHPLGTARMAGEPELGALDPSATVWGAPGLHVSDASMLPGSPSVNPQISIIALAERNAMLWAKEGVGS